MKKLFVATLAVLAIAATSAQAQAQADVVRLPLTPEESQAVASTVYIMRCATSESIAAGRIEFAQWMLDGNLKLVRYGTLDKFVPQFDRIVTNMGVEQFCARINQVLDSNIEQFTKSMKRTLRE